jgi:hypothetical protein
MTIDRLVELVIDFGGEVLSSFREGCMENVRHSASWDSFRKGVEPSD